MEMPPAPDISDQPIRHEERPVDEIANLITHGLGFMLSIPASIALMSLAFQDDRQYLQVACVVYCISLMALYAASTLSHIFYDLAWRRFFRTLDQACIFLLIAGSFTPVAVVYFREGWMSYISIAMWVLAILGVILVFVIGNMTSLLKLTYLALGWLPIICLKELFQSMPFAIFVWMIAGGIFYSVGTLFLKFDTKVKYFHALWHTFVIAGSSCHYIAILLLIVMN